MIIELVINFIDKYPNLVYYKKIWINIILIINYKQNKENGISLM